MKTTVIAIAAFSIALSSAAWAAPQTAGTRADNDPATAAASNDSAQPVSDTWITTKVKTELMASSEVAGTDISVETVNGVVKLSGSVDKTQADKAASIAKNIDGVKKVDTSGLIAAHKSARK
ncbi:BON domain-containing protein [Pseudomonas sp. CGJS7]|uniref:BON domain-containing protein n=1 Tax=Pseudomonas sp. CGJS7 TaxID=3109348 RepID=UPI00300B99F7